MDSSTISSFLTFAMLATSTPALKSISFTPEVYDAMVRDGAVYFAAIGGAGALLSKCIKSSEIVCYEDLGAEAIRRLYVEDFPVVVVADSHGGNLYESAVKEFM